jgi:hypothetical protein
MLRFSDRLNSLTTSVQTPSKATIAPSDESLRSRDNEYNKLLELLGLHQTVKILEAEYCWAMGLDDKFGQANLKNGYRISVIKSDKGGFQQEMSC